jgi:hypothetical protein
MLILWSIFKEEATRVFASTGRIVFDSESNDKPADKRADNVKKSTIITSAWLGGLGSVVIYLIDPDLNQHNFVTSLVQSKEFKPLVDSFIQTYISILFKLGILDESSSQTETKKDAFSKKHYDYVSVLLSSILLILMFLTHIDFVLLFFLYYHYSTNVDKNSPERMTQPPTATETKQISTDQVSKTSTESIQQEISPRATPITRSRRSSQTLPSARESAKNQAPTSNSTESIIANALPGKLNINLIRGRLLKTGQTYFGQTVKPYVVFKYNGEKVKVSDVASKLGTDFEWYLNDISISLVKDCNELIFEVYDKNDCTSKHKGDILLLQKAENIREWIANKRFEDIVKMKDAHGEETDDHIQLSVKVIYENNTATTSNGSHLDKGTTLSKQSSISSVHTPRSSNENLCSPEPPSPSGQDSRINPDRSNKDTATPAVSDDLSINKKLSHNNSFLHLQGQDFTDDNVC